MKIVDMHSHINCSSLNKAKKALHAYLQIQKKSEIQISLFMPEGTDPELNPFKELETLVEAMGSQESVYAIANIDIQEYRYTDLTFLEHLIVQKKVKAFKFYPGYCPYYPFDARCFVFYKMAEHFNIPVMVHTGDLWSDEGGLVKYSHPIHMDQVAKLFPKVNFILCHIGNPYFTDAKLVLYNNANLYADGSGLFYHQSPAYFQSLEQDLVQVFAYQDQPKILFGTDFPFTPALEHVLFWKKFFREHPEFRSHQNPFFSGLAKRLFKI